MQVESTCGLGTSDEWWVLIGQFCTLVVSGAHNTSKHLGRVMGGGYCVATPLRTGSLSTQNESIVVPCMMELTWVHLLNLIELDGVFFFFPASKKVGAAAELIATVVAVAHPGRGGVAYSSL